MGDTHIRPATPADAPAIARIHIVAWQVAYRSILPATFLAELSIPRRTQGWAKRLETSPDGVFVAEQGGVVIGWVLVGACRDPDKEPATGELQAIYLDPACWRRGVGGLLHARAEQELIATGHREVVLWVLAANEPARCFYERIGFRPDGAIKQEAIGDATYPIVRYLKSLPAAAVDGTR